ncbi:hypothetical protein V495_00109, partial [Pseudogymnoascus sp. VKM F-4514 (FW-929)]
MSEWTVTCDSKRVAKIIFTTTPFATSITELCKWELSVICNGCSSHLRYNSICNMHSSTQQMGAFGSEAGGSTRYVVDFGYLVARVGSNY